MGILLEADYKGVLQGRESIGAGLRRAFSGQKGGSVINPLERGEREEEELQPKEEDGQLTYELMNRDSGKSWLSAIVMTNHLTSVCTMKQLL